MKRKLVLGLMAAGMATGVYATNVTTGFGTIPGSPGLNPYSGSGIPFDTSEYEVITGIPSINAGGDTLTVAMAATQHGSGNPAPGNNGAGTYYVQTGLNAGRSKWNFDFYLNSSGNLLNDYTFTITELNLGNGESFTFNPLLIPDNVGGPASAGNSESLDFSPFGPAIGYNPNANDTYDFTLDVFVGGSLEAQDGITVVDGTGAPDGGITAALLGGALVGLQMLRRKLLR